jgi:hypothetical protein
MIRGQSCSPARPAMSARAITGKDDKMPVIHDFARWLLWIALVAAAMIGLHLASQALPTF